MTKDKRFYLFWFAFLLTPAFIAFVNASVVNPPFLQQNPTVTVPPQTVGTTDSLQIATQLFKTNKHKEALKISLALLQKATQSKDSFQIEKISYLIANIFKNTNNYDKALEYFNKTLLIAQNSSNLVYISTLQLDIGVMYTKINNLNSASYYYKKIINLNENNNQIKQLQARAYANLSGVYFFQGNLVQAESYALEALYLQKDFKNHLAIAHAQNNLASIYLEQNRFRDAKRELFEALSLIENNKTREGFDYKETINDNLSWALYNLKDYRAYEY
ncbi:MAG TPA: tetratricopeptide repeat protein, partial [Lutibacter sp.]|nr:tetratricopeptide repeat protein [Lutibacter sp.]